MEYALRVDATSMSEFEQVPGEVVVQRSTSMRKLNDSSLVLRAMGIEHEIRQEAPIVYALVVRERDATRAVDELTRYERENRGWPPRVEGLDRATDWVFATTVYGALIATVHVIATRAAFGFDWYRAGAADGAQMRAGQWWRAVTALTLHSGLGHLLGNLLFGAFFAAILAHSVGSGVAWLSIVVAGSLGFALEALLRDGFTTIGASTAVFAALGIQVAYQWRLRGKLLNPSRAWAWKRWVPVIGGLVLLGYLGINDPRESPTWAAREAARIDVVGHACGFVAGLAVGWWLAWGPRGVVAGRRAQAVCGVLAPALIVIAWAIAVASSK